MTSSTCPAMYVGGEKEGGGELEKEGGREGGKEREEGRGGERRGERTKANHVLVCTS